jgi:hypothetical protein
LCFKTAVEDKMFDVYGDSIEYDGRRVAVFLPKLGAVQRDYVEEALYDYKPSDGIEDDRDEWKFRCEQAEAECGRLEEQIKKLELEVESADEGYERGYNAAREDFGGGA